MTKLATYERSLISKMNRAFREYPMLSDGDRVAVAVSGGHDSLSLLRLLKIRQPIAVESYDLVAVHILGNASGPDDYIIHQPLVDWLENSGIEHVVAPMQLAEREELPMNCQRFTWNRRSTLFRVAYRHGCNKIAFGHHFDDMVETALLNLLYQGRMASMYPYATYFGGIFHLIRPLMYIKKKELKYFANKNDFPGPPPDCPNSKTSKRKMVADLLESVDQGYQNMRRNIFRAAMYCMNLEEEASGEKQPGGKS